MYAKTLLAFLALFLFDDSYFVTSEPSWTSLRTTYSLNLFSSRAFAKLPRRESKARVKDYTKIPGGCTDGNFLGVRYMKGEDPTAVTLYDENGFIAGLQHGIPKSDVDRVDPSYSYSRSSAYQIDRINNHDIYFLTVYFVDPSIICNGGRSQEDYDEQGTGTGLYIQNGTDAIRDSIHVPMYEEGTNVTHWVKGECKRSIGVHYWYDYSPHMSCARFFPFSIVYNRGKITGFVFVNLGHYDFSDKFEHVEKSDLDDYMDEPLPQCIEDEYEISGGLSMMHVFFSVRPWNTFC